MLSDAFKIRLGFSLTEIVYIVVSIPVVTQETGV